MNNWLEIAVAVFLIGMVLNGHYKGFIRLAVSMVAFVATLAIVNMAMPRVSVILKDNTPIVTWIQQGVEKASGLEFARETEGDGGMPAEQRMAIEGLNIPKEIKEILIANNNNEVYQALGVEAFTDYIGNYLANIIVNLAGFVLLFVIIYAVIHMIMRALDIMAKLPILSGLNKIAGALLGGVQGLLYLWVGCLILTACSSAGWAMTVINQIEASGWLSFLYHYNIVSKLAFGIIQGIVS